MITGARDEHGITLPIRPEDIDHKKPPNKWRYSSTVIDREIAALAATLHSDAVEPEHLKARLHGFADSIIQLIVLAYGTPRCDHSAKND